MVFHPGLGLLPGNSLQYLPRDKGEKSTLLDSSRLAQAGFPVTGFMYSVSKKENLTRHS